jgi:hypothetical protein
MDVAIHSFDPSDRNEVVLTVRTVFLRQFDRAASDVIDHPDLFATGRNNVHVLLDAGDTRARTLRWAADAGLFLYEIDRFLSALRNLVANVLCGIHDSVARVRGFVLDRTRHDQSPGKMVLASECRLPCSPSTIGPLFSIRLLDRVFTGCH